MPIKAFRRLATLVPYSSGLTTTVAVRVNANARQVELEP